MIYSVNNNTAYNYSKTFARPKWQVYIFKIVAPLLQNNSVCKSKFKCALMKKTVKKTELLKVNQKWLNKIKHEFHFNKTSVFGFSKLKHLLNKQCFECKQYVCYRSDLAFFNLRTYFSNILKAIHNCWVGARNNKNVLFISGNEQTEVLKVQLLNNVLLKQYVRQTLPQVNFNFEQQLNCSSAAPKGDHAKSSTAPFSEHDQVLRRSKSKHGQENTTKTQTLKTKLQTKQTLKDKQQVVKFAFDHLISFLKLTKRSFNKLNSSFVSISEDDTASSFPSPGVYSSPRLRGTGGSFREHGEESKVNKIEKQELNFQKKQLNGQNKINKLNAYALHAASRQSAVCVNPSNVFIANTKASFKKINNLLVGFKFVNFVVNQQCFLVKQQNNFKIYENKKFHFLEQHQQLMQKRKCVQLTHLTNNLLNNFCSNKNILNSMLTYDEKTRRNKSTYDNSSCGGGKKRQTLKQLMQKSVKHLNFNEKTRKYLPLINTYFNLVSQPYVNYDLQSLAFVNKSFTGGLLEQQQPVQTLIAHNQQWKNKKQVFTKTLTFKKHHVLKQEHIAAGLGTSFWINKRKFKNKLLHKQKYVAKAKTHLKNGAWLKKQVLHRFYSPNNALRCIVSPFGKLKKQKLNFKKNKFSFISQLVSSHVNVNRRKGKKTTLALNPLLLRRRKTQAKTHATIGYYKSLLFNKTLKTQTCFAKNALLKQAHLIFFVNAEQQKGLVNQAKRLQIPTIGLLGTCTNSYLGRPDFKSQSLTTHVNIPIIGNAHSIFFVTQLVDVLINVFAKANSSCVPFKTRDFCSTKAQAKQAIKFKK